MPRLPARPLPVFLASATLVAVALYLVGVAVDHWALRMVTKPVPMVALIVWAATAKPAGTTTWPLTAGLVLGLAGDVLLEIGDATFLFGLVSFLLGHIAYGVCFTKAAGRLGPLQALPMAGYAVAAALLLVPQLGDMAVPVVAYMVVICVMAWRAAVWAEVAGGWAWASLAGAVLFLFSDTLIAMDRFVQPIDGIRPAIILTYWLGQAALAAGILWTRPVRSG